MTGHFLAVQCVGSICSDRRNSCQSCLLDLPVGAVLVFMLLKQQIIVREVFRITPTCFIRMYFHSTQRGDFSTFLNAEHKPTLEAKGMVPVHTGRNTSCAVSDQAAYSRSSMRAPVRINYRRAHARAIQQMGSLSLYEEGGARSQLLSLVLVQ